MNENQRIDNPRTKIVKRVGAKAQDEKIRRNTTQTNNGRNFQNAKFSVIDLLLTDGRNLLVHSQNRPREMPLSKPLNT